MRRKTAGIGVFTMVAVGVVWAGLAGAQSKEGGPATQLGHSRSESEPPMRDQHGVQQWTDYEQMHAFFIDGFVKTEGAGNDRMITPRKMARSSTLYIEGELFRVGSVHLISTRAEGKSFAYDTQSDASMRSIQHARRRTLQPYEAQAVTQLKSGSEAELQTILYFGAFGRFIRRSTWCLPSRT